LIRELAAANKNTIVTVTLEATSTPTTGSIAFTPISNSGIPESVVARRSLKSSSAPSIPPAISPSPLSGAGPTIRFTKAITPNQHEPVVYKEGVFVGYRGYEHVHVKPLYPFGYGLSYAAFQYSHLEVKPDGDSSTGARYNVTFDVTNTGHRAGADVTQVYVAEADPKVRARRKN